MKNRRNYVIGLAAISMLIFSLTGCGERRVTEEERAALTETETEIHTEPVTVKQTETETESETQKLITSVDYTSKDGTVKITLPDNTWKVTQDADEMRVFSSGSAAMINIVHASTESAMNSLTVMPSEEELKASLTRQYSDAEAFDVEKYESYTISDVDIYRYVVRYNADARMWAYSVTYGIVAKDQAYVITGTVTDENTTLLADVEKSVESFRVLKDETLKSVTSDVISGKTQKTTNTTVASTSAGELASLNDYGYEAALYANDTVNVRQAPGTDADIVGGFARGDKVTVIGETSGWFKVSVGGTIGYVRKDFLVSTPANSLAQDLGSGESAGELNTQTNYGSTATLFASSDVNIRTQPSTDSEIMGGLNSGAAVSVVGETDNWFVVSVNGTTGYVSKAFLTYENIASNAGTTSSGNNGNTNNAGADNNGGTTDNSGAAGNTGTGGNSGTTGGAESTDNDAGGTGNSGSSTIHGTITSFDMEYVTVAGDDGNTYSVYYGDASTSSASGLFDGVSVDVTVDNSQTGTDGTLYATNVTGY